MWNNTEYAETLNKQVQKRIVNMRNSLQYDCSDLSVMGSSWKMFLDYSLDFFSLRYCNTDFLLNYKLRSFLPILYCLDLTCSTAEFYSILSNLFTSSSNLTHTAQNLSFLERHCWTEMKSNASEKRGRTRVKGLAACILKAYTWLTEYIFNFHFHAFTCKTRAYFLKLFTSKLFTVTELYINQLILIE